MAGSILIYRSIADWRWGDDPVMVYFWIRILLMANWKDKEWHDKVIMRGSFATTVAALSRQLNLSVKQVRTCLDRLRAGGEVTTDTANNYTLVTICKYDDYQLPTANEGQMKGNCDGKCGDKQKATTKEDNKEIKKEKKEGDTVVSPKKTAVDFSLVKKMWNDAMTRKVPKIQGLSEARKEKVKVRVEEMGGWEEAREVLRDCFRKVNDSDFCNGINDHQWVATFDWLFSNDKNWMKVSEGNYDNKRQVSRFEQSVGVAQRAKNLIGLIYGNTGTTDGLGDSPDEQ